MATAPRKNGTYKCGSAHALGFQLAAILLLALQTTPLNSNCTSAVDAAPLKGGIVQNDLGIDLNALFGIETDKSTNTLYKATVRKVRLGSAAQYAGIAKGDHILSAKVDKDAVLLEIERDGKKYAARLEKQKTAVPETALSSSTEKRPLATQAQQTNLTSSTEQERQDLELLALHDVIIIVDQTGSMNTPDCPDMLSRWQWCRAQTVGLMEQIAARIDNITVVTFNEDFQVFEHSRLKKVEEVYDTNQPAGFTNMVAPLRDRLSDYFIRRSRSAVKPLLIAIITDGVPNRPGGYENAAKAVEQTIIDATKRISNPGEITITFLQVGLSHEGDVFVKDVDECLLSKGAKYDIVQARPFDYLRQVGLKQALIDALKTKALAREK